jgi:hypothetical protein
MTFRPAGALRLPNHRDGIWLVRPDGYIACSSAKAEDIAQYLTDLAIV